MATSTTGEDSEWKTGLTIVAAIVVCAAVLGGGLWYLDVPYGEYAGGLVGAIVGFVAISYFMFGR